MDENNSSFTALAAQVEELAEVCARLSQENAELRERVARLSARPALVAGPLANSPRTFANPLPGGDSQLAGERPPDGTVSRRTIGKALGVAAGVVGAVALVELGARPAAAETSRETAIAKEDPNASDNSAVSSAGSVVRASLGTTGAVIVADNTGAGAGVQATGKSGRGGVFAGSAAQVQLTPGSLSSHPAGGERGDLYADKSGRLWFCTKSGSHATWKQLT
jgi:hypothetical protein